MDIHEELTKLKPMLTMTSAKIDRWTGDEKQSILRESQAQGQALEDAKRGMSTMTITLPVIINMITCRNLRMICMNCSTHISLLFYMPNLQS